jgi:hypothetical protein
MREFLRSIDQKVREAAAPNRRVDERVKFNEPPGR